MSDNSIIMAVRRDRAAPPATGTRSTRVRVRSRVVAAVLAVEVVGAGWSVLVLASRAIAAAGLDGTASAGVLSRTGVIVAAIVLAGALASTAEALWTGRLPRTPAPLHAVRTWATALVVAAHAITVFGALMRDSWLVALVSATVCAAAGVAWSAEPGVRG